MVGLQQKIKTLQQSIDVARKVYSELREVLVKSDFKDAVVVVSGLQQVKAVYSSENFPLDVYQDIFLNIVDACNLALDYATARIGKQIADAQSEDVKILEGKRYAARQGRVTVLIDSKPEFVSLSVEGESELDEFLAEVVVALNDGLKLSLVEASKRLAFIAAGQ